jgi:hypothetical protein
VSLDGVLKVTYTRFDGQNRQENLKTYFREHKPKLAETLAHYFLKIIQTKTIERCDFPIQIGKMVEMQQFR